MFIVYLGQVGGVGLKGERLGRDAVHDLVHVVHGQQRFTGVEAYDRLRVLCYEFFQVVDAVVVLQRKAFHVSCSAAVAAAKVAPLGED